MVALLVVRFRAEQTVPESRHAFYDGLFQLLLSRHDKTKAGYVRERKSKESDFAIEDFFDSLCFTTRKFRKSPIESTDMAGLACAANELAGVKASASDLLDDVTKITCLLLEEGREFRYIHKSVEEFHAARRIKRLPETQASSVYSSLLQDFKWNVWNEELSFLSVMDKYRYLKFFVCQDLEATLCMDDTICSEGAVGVVEKTKNKIANMIGFQLYPDLSNPDNSNKRKWVPGFSSDPASWCMNCTILFMFLDHMEQSGIDWEELFSEIASSFPDAISKNNEDRRHIKVSEVIGECTQCSDELDKVIGDTASDVFQFASDAFGYVRESEARAKLLEI